MRSVSVVTKSGIVSDDKQNIELIEKSDVKAIVQQSLGSVRTELKEHDEKISNLRDQISALQRDISAHKEDIEKEHYYGFKTNFRFNKCLDSKF